jgi:hypothetical protein
VLIQQTLASDSNPLHDPVGFRATRHWEQQPFPVGYGVSVGNSWDSGHTTDRTPAAAKADGPPVVVVARLLVLCRFRRLSKYRARRSLNRRGYQFAGLKVIDS